MAETENQTPAPTKAPGEIEIVKKLTMKFLCGNLKADARKLEIGQAIPLIRVIGLARGLKHGESNFGPWTALTGDFIAEPMHGAKAGERFRSGALFLPDVAQGLVTPYVQSLPKGEAVEVAFGIGMRADEESATGYVYTARFLRQPQANDPLMTLLGVAMPEMKLIATANEAPAEAPALEASQADDFEVPDGSIVEPTDEDLAEGPDEAPAAKPTRKR